MRRQKWRKDKDETQKYRICSFYCRRGRRFRDRLGWTERGESEKGGGACDLLPGPCLTAEKPVCAAKGGMKFTYASACIAVKDSAKVVSGKACPAKKAMKHKKHKKKAKASKKKAIKK
jgi:hypothetical protein